MFTPAELDVMRAEATALLDDTCTINRKTSTSDGGGGTTEDWAEHAAGVPCLIEPATGGGETGTAGSRINDETTHLAHLPAGTDVTTADQVVVDGVVYEVTNVRTWGSHEVVRDVEIKEA